jgi:hypothetical protein
MPESIDIHIKNIQDKLQLLLKKYAVLEKENVRLSKENETFKSHESRYQAQINLLDQQVNILKASCGKLDGADKKYFEKSINGYIKSIEKCIAILNN